MTDLVVDGLRFHVADQGRSEPLVLLHGFTGSSESWWPVIDALAAQRRIVAFDLVGHGQSEAPTELERYRFDRAVDDLAAVAGQIGQGHAVWLGYSLGGRLALGLAIRHPGLVSALILESATPGIADPDEREARRHADDELAMWIEEAGREAFVERWERLPLWATQEGLPEHTRKRQREIRLGNRPHGLANSLRGMGQGHQPSLWEWLGEIAAPVLLIAGERDEKFATIAARMHALIPGSTLCIVPEAGHAVHLEQPRGYADTVLDFLTGAAPGAAAISKELLA